jgi:hypothetical protein
MSVVQVPKKLNLGEMRDAAPARQVKTFVEPFQTSFSANQKIIINFPSISSNFKGSYLSFTAQAVDSTVVGAVGVAFQFPIATVFERVRVVLGSEVLEEIASYDLLHGSMSNLWSGDLAANQAVDGLQLEGPVLQATRHTKSLLADQYRVKLYCDSLRKYYPLHLINSQLRLEITLNSNSRALFDDAAAPNSTYTVSNVRYHYKQQLNDPQIDGEMRSRIAAGQYQIRYRPFVNYQSTALGTSTAAQIDIPARLAVVNRVLAINRLVSTVSAVGTDNKCTKYSTGINNLTRLSLKVNNEIIPPEEHVEFANDAAKNLWTLYQDYIDCFNDISDVKIRGYNAICSDDWKSASRQVMAFDLRADPSDPNLFNNGAVLNQAGAQLVLRQTLSAAYGSAALTDFFLQYEAILSFNAGGFRHEF